MIIAWVIVIFIAKKIIFDFLASVARVAKYIGIKGMPVITPGGFTSDFTKKKTTCSNEYFMTVNSGPTDYRSFGEFFHLIMDR